MNNRSFFIRATGACSCPEALLRMDKDPCLSMIQASQLYAIKVLYTRTLVDLFINLLNNKTKNNVGRAYIQVILKTKHVGTVADSAGRRISLQCGCAGQM